MSAIGFRGIAKSFGTTPVLTALELEVHEGEFMVLVGPSGCGKSTALRLIAGLEEPSAGEITIAGRRVNDVAPKDRDVAMVFQSYALYPHMTVRENIAFGLRIRDVPAPEIESRVGDAAGVLGLAELLDRKPKALSGGQRQRVALGRAIVRKPSVFLFDEPLSNLDAELRVQMRAELSGLQQRLGTTTVYVTHDQVEAMTLGHRIAVLAPTGAGASPNLQQVGAPLEIYDRPANAFVARFIGSPPMNVFAATLSADGTRVAAPGFEAPVPAAFRAAATRKGGQGVLVGLRPEHIGPDAREAEVPVSLAGTVEIAETVGSEVIVHLRVGTERVLARYATRQVPKLGTPLALVGDGARLHLFDGVDAQRLAEG